MADINSKEFKMYYRTLPPPIEIARACGWDLGELADRCHVSYRTMMNWNSGGGLGLTFQARVVLRQIYDLYRTG